MFLIYLMINRLELKQHKTTPDNFHIHHREHRNKVFTGGEVEKEKAVVAEVTESRTTPPTTPTNTKGCHPHHQQAHSNTGKP